MLHTNGSYIIYISVPTSIKALVIHMRVPVPHWLLGCAAMEEPAWKSSLMKFRSKLRSVCHIGKCLPDLRQLLTAMEYSCVQGKPNDVSCVDELVRILHQLCLEDYQVNMFMWYGCAYILVGIAGYSCQSLSCVPVYYLQYL